MRERETPLAKLLHRAVIETPKPPCRHPLTPTYPP